MRTIYIGSADAAHVVLQYVVLGELRRGEQVDATDGAEVVRLLSVVVQVAFCREIGLVEAVGAGVVGGGVYEVLLHRLGRHEES